MKRYIARPPLRHLFHLAALAIVSSAVPAFGQVTIKQSNPGGFYKAGETATFTVAAKDDAALKAMTNVTARFRIHGAAAGKNAGELKPIDLSNGPVELTTTSDQPLTTMLEVNWKPADGGKPGQATLGAAFDHTKIEPSSPPPDDFDSFWQEQIKIVSAIPLNAKVEPVEIDDKKLEYAKVTLDNIDGTHVQGQLARPKQVEGKKYPAVLLVQYAGIYALPRNNVTDRAKNGWIALNIMAHDLPFDLTKEEYDAISKDKLKNYAMIGNQSRDTSYFKRMFLGCYQGAEFLTQQPDWNGEVLLVSGGSQGGMQAIAAAALHPKITQVIAHVPAGCDTTQAHFGRLAGWPGWAGWGSPKESELKGREKIIETSRYFDPVNFAHKIKAPTLITLGMVDTVSTPSGTLVLYNLLAGPKRLAVYPNADHQGVGGAYNGAYKVQNDWWKALQEGKPLPMGE